MENLNIGELLISVAALLVAITTIYNFFSNIGIFTKKKITKAQKQNVEAVLDEELEERVTKILTDKMPDILYQHDLEIRKTYLADRQRYLNEIKGEVLNNIQTELMCVSSLAEQYDGLQEQYEALVISAKDVLREKIMAVYHKNKHRRALEESEREALDQYYKDYKAIKGNSYIDRYYGRMKNWEVIPDDYDDDSEE